MIDTIQIFVSNTWKFLGKPALGQFLALCGGVLVAARGLWLKLYRPWNASIQRDRLFERRTEIQERRQMYPLGLSAVGVIVGGFAAYYGTRWYLSRGRG